MRSATIAGVLMALLAIAPVALAGPNGDTTLVLHAVATTFGPCQIADPCPDASVNVAANSQQAIYLIVRNYDNIAGVQSAFDFGGWTLAFGLWDCQSNQVAGTVPTAPGGPVDGTIATAFDCISGGASAVMGRLHMVATGQCVTQIDSAFPFGTHVVSCIGDADVIDPLNRGTVCVAAGGYDACDPVVPVEPTTWGTIKSQYR